MFLATFTLLGVPSQIKNFRGNLYIGIFCISVFAFFDIAIVPLNKFFLSGSRKLRMLGAIKRNNKNGRSPT